MKTAGPVLASTCSGACAATITGLTSNANLQAAGRGVSVNQATIASSSALLAMTSSSLPKHRPKHVSEHLFQRRFLHPRYWLIWLGVGLMVLLTILPHRLQIMIGSALGKLGIVFGKRRRRVVEVNIRLCFPDLDADAQKHLVRRVFRSTGISLIETARVWFWSAGPLTDRVTVHGLEHLAQASAQGKGVILLGAHYSTLDYCGAALSQFIGVDVIYRPNKNPLLDTLMTRGRVKNFPNSIERGDIRAVLQNLRKGHTVWYGPDQDFGRKNAVFAPFFGVPAATITATSRIAKISGSPIVFLRHYRRADDDHYDIYLSEPINDFPGVSPDADAARVNQLIEDAVRPYPEQYWWVHRRFKTRPEGEPRLY